MSSKRVHVVTFGVTVAALSFVWALPALASPAATKATVTVTEGKPSEFGIQLGAKSVAHGSVTFKVTNKGAAPHDFKICSSPTTKPALTCAGTGTKPISPGATASLTVKFAKAGSYEYLCTLPGHAAAGMKGLLKVT